MKKTNEKTGIAQLIISLKSIVDQYILIG